MVKHIKAISFVGAILVALVPIASVSATKYETTTVTYPYYGFVEDPENPWQTAYDALDETGTVEYSDAFFSEPSPGDHPELRTVSYALALAGYENQADGYPFDPSTPNPKLISLLNQLGFSDYQSWDVSSEIDGHSMGTTIGRKTLADGQELIVVAPRNYNYLTEWLSNFNVGTSGDHAGFTESAQRIKDRLDEYIHANHLSNYKLWMVGYSRGGAVIDLAAKTINENLSDYSMAPDDFYAYTFGAPRASLTEPACTNIHDVKDGNDLILGYLFPETWGFYNTGTYEEIHPADLIIPTSVINISDLADPSRAANVLTDNEGLTEQIDNINGRDFMDAWTQFVTENGLTREYFDTEVKAPLSAIMQAYQLRTLDKQSEFTDFLTDTSKGLAGMVAGNALYDLLANYGGDLSIFPTYLNLVKVMKGTATDSEVTDLISTLSSYMDEYENYETKLGETPTITKTEFTTIKENLPKLVKALAPLLIADAKYTQETFGENYSLYYTYTLASNAKNLVIGHIPESIMPILKSLIPNEEEEEEEEPSDPNTDDNETTTTPNAPNTGHIAQTSSNPDVNTSLTTTATLTSFVILAVFGYILKKLYC